MAESIAATTPVAAPAAASGTAKFEAVLTMTVTDLARRKLQEFLGDRSLSEVAVRMSVHPGGCSGASYGMEFAEAAEPGEFTLEANGVRILVSPAHAPLLNGITIDFVDELMGGGFKIGNPNATSGCGCGKSFA